MFYNSNNKNVIYSATQHHKMCAMRFIQLNPKERGKNKNKIIGGYKIRQISCDTAYLVPKNAKETWSEVLFFKVPNWDYPYND